MNRHFLISGSLDEVEQVQLELEEPAQLLGGRHVEEQQLVLAQGRRHADRSVLL